MRDPRNAVASFLDASRKGSWSQKSGLVEDETPGREGSVDAVGKSSARKCLRNLTQVREAFDAHEGPKTLVRHEDLRTDTLGTMRRLYSELAIPVDAKQLVRAFKKHAWEKLPEGVKGQGKFYRKGTPGGWRDDLTPRRRERWRGSPPPSSVSSTPEEPRPVGSVSHC